MPRTPPQIGLLDHKQCPNVLEYMNKVLPQTTQKAIIELAAREFKKDHPGLPDRPSEAMALCCGARHASPPTRHAPCGAQHFPSTTIKANVAPPAALAFEWRINGPTAPLNAYLTFPAPRPPPATTRSHRDFHVHLGSRHHQQQPARRQKHDEDYGRSRLDRGACALAPAWCCSTNHPSQHNCRTTAKLTLAV